MQGIPQVRGAIKLCAYVIQTNEEICKCKNEITSEITYVLATFCYSSFLSITSVLLYLYDDFTGAVTIVLLLHSNRYIKNERDAADV